MHSENRIEPNRRSPGQPRTLGIPLLLAKANTTKPLQCRNGLVVLAFANSVVCLFVNLLFGLVVRFAVSLSGG